MTMNYLGLAQLGYQAYAASTGGKTFDGREMPKWDDLPLRIKAAWAEAARAIDSAGAAACCV